MGIERPRPRMGPEGLRAGAAGRSWSQSPGSHELGLDLALRAFGQVAWSSAPEGCKPAEGSQGRGL